MHTILIGQMQTSQSYIPVFSLSNGNFTWLNIMLIRSQCSMLSPWCLKNYGAVKRDIASRHWSWPQFLLFANWVLFCGFGVCDITVGCNILIILICAFRKKSGYSQFQKQRLAQAFDEGLTNFGLAEQKHALCNLANELSLSVKQVKVLITTYTYIHACIMVHSTHNSLLLL